MEEKEEIIKKWKELGIDRAEFVFSCGGDSMNDTELIFYDSKDTEIEFEFNMEIENEVYQNITFYEVSGDNYQGEAGTVTIKLDEEDNFTFDKDAEAEYKELNSVSIKINLTKEEYDYINRFVRDFEVSDSYDNITYSKDFFMTEEMKNLESSILDKITEAADNYDLDNDDDYRCSNFVELGDELTLVIDLQYYTTTYEASDW